MSGSGTAEHASGKYKVEITVTWMVVTAPLAYGIITTLTKALQIFNA